MQKTCFKCGKLQPLTEFYKHPQMSDGHLGKCKTCTKRDVASNIKIKENDPEWVIQERKRQRIKEDLRRKAGKVKTYSRKTTTRHSAHTAVATAVRDGKLIKLACAVCNNEDSEGHHEDYTKPLDVVWLCSRHHADRHIHLRDCQTRKTDPLPIDVFIQQLK